MPAIRAPIKSTRGGFEPGKIQIGISVRFEEADIEGLMADIHLITSREMVKAANRMAKKQIKYIKEQFIADGHRYTGRFIDSLTYDKADEEQIVEPVDEIDIPVYNAGGDETDDWLVGKPVRRYANPMLIGSSPADTDKPGTEMITRIQNWMSRKQIKPRFEIGLKRGRKKPEEVDGGKGEGRVAEFRSTKKLAGRDAAFLVARSILRRGTIAVKSLDLALEKFNETEPQFEIDYATRELEHKAYRALYERERVKRVKVFGTGVGTAASLHQMGITKLPR